MYQKGIKLNLMEELFSIIPSCFKRARLIKYTETEGFQKHKMLYILPSVINYNTYPEKPINKLKSIL
jgi:hypothetical protein